MQIEQTLTKIRTGGIDPRDIAIPSLPATANDASSFSQIPLARTLVREPVVNALSDGFSGASYYRDLAGSHPIYNSAFSSAPQGVWLSKTAASALRPVEAFLRPYGVRLYLLDGIRTRDTQAEIRDAFIAWKRQEVILEGGDPSPELLNRLADKYYSRAPAALGRRDPSTWFAHCTGGALDVTLADLNGRQLDLGCIFDDMRPHVHTAYYESNRRSSAGIRNLRRLLFWAMLGAGSGYWVNYPFECFHFEHLTPGFRTQFGLQNATAYGLTLPGNTANVGPASLPAAVDSQLPTRAQ